MLAAEKKRTVTASSASSDLPDLPPGLFGEEPTGPRTKQASSPLSADAYMDFLHAPSPGRNVAEVGLDSLWKTPPALPVQASDDGLSSLWSHPSPTPTVEPELEALWGSPTASDTPEVEPELAGLWDTPGRSATAEDAGDALSGLFMNNDALSQAQLTGQDLDSGSLPPLNSRTASTRGGSYEVEFDTDMNFGADVRPSGGASAPRYRIDRPPVHAAFSPNRLTAQDGVVVGQRGPDGRFQRTASVAAPRPATHVAPTTLSRQEAIARVERAPQPAPRTATLTTYDVLRKGGLDL